MTAPVHDSSFILTPVPALSDNYIWLLRKGNHALAVDPGEAAPILAQIDQGLQLDAIFITHHHRDHVGGVQALQQRSGARVYGPADETLPVCDVPLRGGQTVSVPTLGLQFQVLDIPGHTAGHIAYTGVLDDGCPLVFCGDTLFAGGCGRVFEGTPAQMVQSLAKLAALADDTLVCCAHEYTVSNLHWARQVEPGNVAMQACLAHAMAQRDRNQPTVPTTLAQERQTNPFLRTAYPSVQAAASRHAGRALNDEIAVFATLREWKNNFR